MLVYTRTLTRIDTHVYTRIYIRTQAIDDIKTATVESYDTLNDVFSLFRTLAKNSDCVCVSNPLPLANPLFVSTQVTAAATS